MKNTFSEYYPLTSDQIKSLFENSFIVLDTNVLLNFYRYSAITNQKFFEVLDMLKEKLWMPYQIGREFYSHRIDEINNQRSVYIDAKKEISTLKSKFEDKNRNPFISSDSLVLFDRLNAELDEAAEKYTSLLKNDVTLMKIDSIFENKVGKKINSTDLEIIFKEGKERYKSKIPPGYSDEKDKSEDIRKYGDLIIWKQMIEHSISDKKNCFFVTDDRKEDWWLIDKHKNIRMPLPELRNEFYFETKFNFYAFQPFNFLEIIGKNLEMNIEQKVIEEVKESNTVYQSYNDIDLVYLKEFKKGAIAAMETILTQRGYQIDSTQVSVNVYVLKVYFPEIRDIKRIFYETLDDLVSKYAVEIINEDSW